MSRWTPRREERGILPFWADGLSVPQRMTLRRLVADGPRSRATLHGCVLLALANRRLIAVVGDQVHLTEEGMDVASDCVLPVPASRAITCPVCGRVGDRTDAWERRWMTFHSSEHEAGRPWSGRDPREEPPRMPV